MLLQTEAGSCHRHGSAQTAEPSREFWHQPVEVLGLECARCYSPRYLVLKVYFEGWQSLAQNPATKASDFGSVVTFLCSGQFILAVPCQAPCTQRFLVNLRNQLCLSV